MVSTNVGGVTEVLPHDMIHLANPDPADLIRKLEEAIPKAKNIPAHKFHEKVKNLYNWRDVAARTVIYLFDFVKFGLFYKKKKKKKKKFTPFLLILGKSL